MGIFFESWRQLKQNRAESLAEPACNLQKVFERVRAIAELRPVRDFLRCFEREPKIFGRKRFPILNRLWRRDPVKSVIYFCGRKSIGVKRQHLRGQYIFARKISVPHRSLNPRGADPELHASPSM